MVVGDYIKFKCNGKFILGEIVYITENIDEGKISVSVKTSNDLYMAITEDDIYKTVLDKDDYTLVKNKIENVDFYKRSPNEKNSVLEYRDESLSWATCIVLCQLILNVLFYNIFRHVAKCRHEKTR